MNAGLWNQRANGNSFCRLFNTKTIRDRGVISPTVPSLFFITHAGAVKGGPACTVLRQPLDYAVNAGEIRPHWVS